MTRPYSNNEIRALLASAATSDRDRAILFMFIGGGVSLGEMAGMKVEDIDWPADCILIHGDGAKDRWIAPGQRAMAALKVYANGRRGPLWGIKARSIAAVVSRCAERAGLEGINPRGLRQWFAAGFIKNGGDMDALRIILGYSTLEQAQEQAVYMEVAS